MEARAKAEASQAESDSKFNDVLIRREELEVRKLEMETKSTGMNVTLKKIEVLQTKIDTLQPGSSLHNILSTRLNELFKEI